MLYNVYVEGQNIKYKDSKYEKYTTGISEVVDDMEDLFEDYEVEARDEEEAIIKAKECFYDDFKRDEYTTEIQDVTVDVIEE